MIKALALFTTFFVASSGTAQAFSAADFPSSTLAGKTTFGSGTIGGGSLGPGALSIASDGTVLAKGPVAFSTARGLSVEAQLVSKIAKPAVAAALGRFFIKSIPIVATGSALYELAKELGYGVSSNNSPPAFTRTQSNSSFHVYGGYNVAYDTFASSPAAVCAMLIEGNYTKSIHFEAIDPSNGFPGFCVVDTGAAAGNAFKVIPKGSPDTITPVSSQEVIDSLSAKTSFAVDSTVPQVVQQAIESGITFPATADTLTGPATVVSPAETTQTSSGSSVVNNVTNNVYNGPTVTTSTVSTTQNYSPSGAAIGPPSVKVDLPVNTLPPDAKPVTPEKIVVCGLPDTPACRIDEQDTPKPDPAIDGKKVTDDITKPLKDFAADPAKALPQLPQLNWAFTLPSGCVPISIPAFAPFLQTIDICQFQPMFHDVMSMIWVMGALFGAISMFWRNTLSQN